MHGRTQTRRVSEIGTDSTGLTRRRTKRTSRTIALVCGIVMAAIFALGFAPSALAANPKPVQTYYVPFPEDQILTALQTISNNTTPASPITTIITITTVANNTIIYYDQWENGYDLDIANPINVYSAGNPGGTQIWGDNNAANGIAPGFSTDIINSGAVITLRNDVVTTTRQSVIDFDGQDKFAATKTIAVTRTSWAAGSTTLLAGCVEVFDTNNWGTDFRAPVGTDIPDGTDYQMFEYTSLSILAGEEGATVSVDVNNDGTFEYSNQSLAQGAVLTVAGNDNSGAGMYAGAHVVSDKPVQVDILSGDIGSNYESRDSALLPTNLWASSYYTPVSTPTSQSGTNGVDTSVWLYNPDPANSISVTYTRREGATSPGTNTTSTITVPAGGYYKQVITQNTVATGAHFYTSGATFYAYSTTNSNDPTNTGTPPNYTGNQAWDWSFTLIPQSSLTTQALVGLGIGRDPTSFTNPTENGNPLWLTTVGNGETAQTVYIDYDADPTTGPLTDPNGNKYDTSVSLRELQPAKIYVPDTFAVDATSSVTTGSVNNLNSRTWSHTTGTAQHRLMLVGVAIAQNTSAYNVASVTYAGQALSFVGRQLSAGTNPRSQVEIWGLANPPSGTANVVVTLGGNRAFAASATTFSGVNVSGGLASALGTLNQPVFTSATGNNNTPTVDVTTSARQAVYDVVCVTRTSAMDAVTEGGGQTALWNQTADFAGAPYMRGRGSWERATAATTTMSWTNGGTRRWAIGAVTINTRDTLDQTGVLAYTLAASGTVKLAAAWGQDPANATAGGPGLDVGTSIPPMPEFSPGKSSSLAVDNDTDGYISPGDVLTYTITAYNISRLPVPDVIIRDTIPSGCDYVPNSTYKGATLISDNPTGGGATAFPLDNDGIYDGYNAGTIGLNGSVTVTFQAQIKTYAALQALGGPTSILNGGSGAALGIRLPVSDQAKLRGRLGDVLWNDLDQDGVQDAGETVVPGVTVRLLNASLAPVLDDTGVAITAVTDANGKYDFKGLYTGTYIVEYEIPAAWEAVFTSANQGADDAVDSDAVATANPDIARTGVITLGSGQTDFTSDAGLRPPRPTLAVVSSFGASVAGGKVVVTWETSSETGTAGYSVERLDARTGSWVKVNEDLVPALLGSPNGGSYSVVDAGAQINRSLTYRLVEMETAGTQVTYGPYVVSARTSLPQGDVYKAIARGQRTVRQPRTALLQQMSTLSLSNKPVLKKVAAANQMRIELIVPGLYRIDASEVASGLGVSEQKAKDLIAKRGVRLTTLGKAVAYFTAGDASAIYFYGQSIDSTYTSTNVYWLAVGKGTTMTAPAPPITTTTSTSSSTTPVNSDAGTTSSTVGGTPADDGSATTTDTGAATTTDTGATSTTATSSTSTTPTTTAPVAVGPATSFIENLHFEQDLLSATGLFHNANDDFWFWTYMAAGDPDVGQQTLEIDTPDALGGSALAVSLHGVSSTGQDSEHHVQVWLNGSLLGETRWTGVVGQMASFDIPSGVLVAGKNLVRLVALQDSGVPYSIVAVDSLDLTYERSAKAVNDRLIFKATSTGAMVVSGLSSAGGWVLDVTDARLPQGVQSSALTGEPGTSSVAFGAVQGRTYLVAAPAGVIRPQAITGVAAPTLAGRQLGADYVVICAPALSDAAARLAAYRSTQGMKTRVVTTTEIYDAFSEGVVTPQAIKSFIACMTSKWLVAPRFVLLAGEGSFDYKNVTGSGDSLVPPLLVDTALNGLAPSDVLLADNKGDDGVPEVAIGRIPVRTIAELDAVLAKIKAYEADATGAWRKNIVLAADDPDGGGDFTASSDMIASVLPSSAKVTKAYLGTLGLAAARTGLLDGFGGGSLLVNYVGHGAVNQLAQEGLLTVADVTALPAAGSRLPVVSALTCVAGNYALPGWDGLGEALVKRADGGAIAVWSAAGLEDNGDSVSLGRLFVQNLFGSSKTVILGTVAQSALKAGFAQQLPTSVLRTYNLLGDPALRVQK